MKRGSFWTGGASLALALSAGFGGAASAQTPAPAPAESEADVVITGSFIRGTPEDAAIPVRAITLQELNNIGTPSNLDLVKSMTDSGAVRGEGDRRGAGSSVGVQTINLRQLGSNRTLVLLNGRRLQDQTSVGVRFSNIAVIPNNAVGRVDTLRDGGAVTYGSDAIGGVVNYITRHDFNGLQVRSNYRFIEDSDGDWDADLLWGTADENGNIMVAAQYQHRSTLNSIDRDWSTKDYLQNNYFLAWSSTASPGTYRLYESHDANGGLSTPLSAAAYNAGPLGGGDYYRQMSSSGLIRDPGCRPEMDLFPGYFSTGSPACYWSLNKTDKLVEESDTYTTYAEVNYEFSNSLRYHGELGYYLLQAPNVINTPSEATASLPVRRIDCTGAGVPAASCTGAGQTLYLPQDAYWADGHNPAVAVLLDQMTSSMGNPTFSATRRDNIINSGGVSLFSWRPFAVGGLPLTGGNEIQRNRLDSIRMTSQLSGDLPKIFGTDFQWTFDATGIHSIFTIDGRDILVERMQAALNGLGGPNCNDIRADLPGSTCQWFNPFSSAIVRNVYTGASNAQADGGTLVDTGSYDGYASGMGLQNDYQLVNWLHAPMSYERSFSTVEVNFKIDGNTPLELPGGPIAVAFGGQYRYQKDLFTLDNLSNEATEGCTRGVDCMFTSGPFLGRRQAGIFGATTETKRQYPSWAAFGQAQFPIFDNVTADIAVRYEKFIGDTTDVDNSVLAPQASVKWQLTDWMALRGVAGKTFANVTPPENKPATTGVTNATVGYGIGAAGFQFNTVNAPNFTVSPETGYNYNVGALFEVGPLSLNIDYYNIKIDNLARNIGIGDVLNALVVPGSPNNATALVNCSSAMLLPQASLGGLPFVTLNSDTDGACVQGVTTMGDAFDTSSATPGTVRYHGLARNINGGSFQTDGIDVQAQLRFDDIAGGRLVLSADATKVLNWDMGVFTFNGVTVSDGYDGVGSFNLAPNKADGQSVFEYKTNLGANYTIGRHNFNWRTTYFSAIDIDTAALSKSFATNANIDNAGAGVSNSGTCVALPNGGFNGPDGVIPGAGQGIWSATGGAGACAAENVLESDGGELPASWNSDFTYRVTLPWETTFTATVQNVFDRDPSFVRTADSYNSFLESPLGRTFRVGLQKKF